MPYRREEMNLRRFDRTSYQMIWMTITDVIFLIVDFQVREVDEDKDTSKPQSRKYD